GDGHGIRFNALRVAATNADQPKAVADGDNREDLFYRLNGYPIALPPLRERRDDIRLLLNGFVNRFWQEYGRKRGGLTRRAR
ncbi:sigma 54-interacting transcriptional regulator, partial [Pseudomonas syringae pv. tagetis]|uniref:sigma 54-interacting transcriptional regulator n=1 Tax=Pseudomonas syringae group genomosp. 7 TaxID=251699 RepID=UPI00376FF715